MRFIFALELSLKHACCDSLMIPVGFQRNCAKQNSRPLPIVSKMDTERWARGFRSWRVELRDNLRRRHPQIGEFHFSPSLRATTSGVVAGKRVPTRLFTGGHGLRNAKAQMTHKNTSETILIRENTLLPAGLVLETGAFLPGWRIVRDIDAGGLDRKIAAAHWHFFFLAGDFKVIVFGRKGPESLRRAVRRFLAKPEAQKFNSLEITGIAANWFLGVPFMSISANFRHIQQGLTLDPANVCILKARTAPEGVMATERYGTLIANP